MKFSEEQIQDIIAMRDNIIKQMDKHQNAVETLQKNLTILDSILKESSFTKASAIKQGKTLESSKNNPIEPNEKSEKSSIPITSGSDGKIIANAYITPDQVSIILADNMEINADTPPFKSFFIDRIIGEMKRKDAVEAENGKIQKESVIDYIINKNGSDIREIIIRNYRQKERVNEIINTAGWSLTRMLEKIKK
ncbi:MAG: hypothetical protein COV65_03735 [Nitrosopumilales archaeon CG11_big_fil_rev_8_21_14_0_20_33_24]|nr:MAG: hypothetical protein COV65_03735 [Nitrosopumilales archaeon CG11_big_fil_rev_8_21_14_0_20_33_24]PIY90567.1 MAG: hypothetical protein COY74_00730 [Nitrosopumilales archaeon CG_4_10_14_0_8_um_filter_34_8]